MEGSGSSGNLLAVSSGDLVADAVEAAESLLRSGESLSPFFLIDRLGDRRSEQFEDDALSEAKARLAEFLRTAAGDERCALVYVGRVGHDEDAIVIESGQPVRGEAEVYIQRFRPRRGRLRGFKLIGEPKPVGTTDPLP